jgi:hypothetical protein
MMIPTTAASAMKKPEMKTFQEELMHFIQRARDVMKSMAQVR